MSIEEGQSDKRIKPPAINTELFWLNTFSANELVLQSKKPVRNATSIPVNSYDTHEFIVKFANTTRNEQGHFVKGPRDEDVNVHYEDGKFRIKITSDYDTWVEKMEKATQKCLTDRTKSFADCLATDVYKDVSKINQEKASYKDYHGRLSGKLRNYTCADSSMETSKPLKSFEFKHLDKTYQIDSMLDLPNAKVWLAHDFITDDECEVFRQSAWGKLQRATVAGADGNTEVSNNRRAQQSGYPIPYDNPENEPVWPLYKKIMEFHNTHGNTRIQVRDCYVTFCHDVLYYYYLNTSYLTLCTPSLSDKKALPSFNTTLQTSILHVRFISILIEML
jgi:hypothetical protein